MTTTTASLIGLVLLLCLCASSTTLAGTGLRLELRPVDAKDNKTMADRLRRAGAGTGIGRRFEVVSGVTAPVIWQNPDFYVAEFGIGSPPQVVQAVVSLSSDLIWTQCASCHHHRCFRQNLDYYNYHKSITGQAVPCDDSMCAAVYGARPCVAGDSDDDGTCPIHDDIFGAVTGVLRTDEFSFGSAKVNIAFGCMDQTSSVGDFLGGASGFLGLGRGALSLVSQVGSKRFSYCFTRIISDHLDSSSSPLFVGSSAGLSGDAPVTSTPLAVNPHGHGDWGSPGSGYYFISMSGMSLGEVPLDIPREAFHGGVIIESALPYMYLVEVAYVALKKEMSRQLGSSLVPSPVGDLELCVARADVSLLLEPLVLHLAGGDWALPTANYWMPVDLTTSCIPVLSASGAPEPWNEVTVVGSFMQQDMHVLYDLESETISFQPADCSSL